MSQHSLEPASMHRRSKLDRAIVASVIAMGAMNILFLAGQLQASPLHALAGINGTGLA